MKPEELKALYGEHYAGIYDRIWRNNPDYAPQARQHVESVRKLIQPGTKWLDVGCGTGWLLSEFPGVSRAGIDLSPAMLSRARAANPDALFFREGDIRDDVPEWAGAWDLVSSSGQPWGYADSLAEIESIAENMSRWTALGGVLFVQPPDIFDLTGLKIPYNFDGQAATDATSSVTGVYWRYHDVGGTHKDLIWPSLDVWVQWLSRWWQRIEVHTWKFDPPFRQLVLARSKRSRLDLGPAEIAIYPTPDAPSSERPTILTSHVPAAPLAALT